MAADTREDASVDAMVAAGRGRIINISGLAARMTGSITALTKTLADELGPKGINVTVVHPGATRTERTGDMVAAYAAKNDPTTEAAEKRMFGRNLVGRIIEAEEVADIVTFLASPRSVAINGDAIAAGGGVPGSIYN